jgi:hypothetical protein
MDFIDQRIAEIRADERDRAKSRSWTLHADTIRKRERTRVFLALQAEVKQKKERIESGLRRSIELTSNPALCFTVRDASPSGATVTVTMSQDGAFIQIETQRHSVANSPLPPSSSTFVDVEVQDDGKVYYAHGEQILSSAKVTDLILAPLLYSIRR